jgi:L,D-transpeptidase catalytic domain
MKLTLRFFTLLFLLSASAFASAQMAPELVTKGPSVTSNATTSKDPNPNTPDYAVIERDTSFMQINTKLKIAAARLKEKAAGLDSYVQSNNFNSEYCFLVDMAIPSGKKRFFVYNIKKGVVEYSALVSHGSGSYKPGCNDELVFSNMPNSNATSLGKYKIGQAYKGAYGLSYRLYGLDSSNSNAYHRAIVLHSDVNVPQTERYPRHIFESAGCPAVSREFLAEIGKYIRTSDKPMLLWIYN